MYEIRPESIKTFITDRNVKLPRFQRKQTWDEKKNFQLCISLFKEYPIGVCILSVDESKGRTIRWLLDGRQRKNALTMMYDDPENIYNWAKKFVGFKNSDQPAELEEKIRTKINEYIEIDDDGEFENLGLTEGEDNSQPADTDNDEVLTDSAYGLDLLVDIIKIIHNKQKKNTGFTKPFDFTKYVTKLQYVDTVDGGVKLSSRKVKSFIDEYRKYCDDEYCDYENEDCFFNFLNVRADVGDAKKTKSIIHDQWRAIKERILIVEKIDNLLTNCKIGMIEVKNLSPADSQKIFNIINSEGEKLTAVEILSAKPQWNIPVANPSDNTVQAVQELYRKIGTVQTDVVRWDLPASLIRRIGKNLIFKEFSDSKTDFEKELTFGFKVLAGIHVGGVKKDDIERLSSVNINWSSCVDELVYDIQNMLKLIFSFDYFRYLKSWRSSLQELTSEAVAMDFLVITYLDWVRKGKPVGDSKAKTFQKNCFILWDELIYQYIFTQWRGASDQKIANNIAELAMKPDMFMPVPEEKWVQVLRDQIYKEQAIDSRPITMAWMKPLLYHWYCLKKIQGPDTDCSIEIDHIIPQTLFKESSIVNKEVIQDSILNLGLLPKNENASKNNKKLRTIESDWLRDEIVKYEFISLDKFDEYSNTNNYQKMFNDRLGVLLEAFQEKRNNILNA